MTKQMTKQRINLIPKELQIAADINTRKILAIWILLVIIALLGIHVIQKAYVLQYKNQIAKQQVENQLLVQQKLDLDQKIAQLRTDLPNRVKMEGIARMLREVSSNYTLPSTLLRELSYLIPPDAWVTQLSFKTQTQETQDKKASKPSRLLIIEGIASDEQVLAEIVINLESHPWFQKVKLELAERDENRYQREVFNFLIKGSFKDGMNEG